MAALEKRRQRSERPGWAASRRPTQTLIGIKHLGRLGGLSVVEFAQLCGDVLKTRIAGGVSLKQPVAGLQQFRLKVRNGLRTSAAPEASEI